MIFIGIRKIFLIAMPAIFSGGIRAETKSVLKKDGNKKIDSDFIQIYSTPSNRYAS